MKQQAMAYFTDTGITLFGMGLFVMTFVAVVVWTVLWYRREDVSHLSQLPLQGEEQ